MVEQRKNKTTSAKKTSVNSNGGQGFLSVGQFLAQKRIEKNLTFEQVSSEINVRAAQIKAIEEGRISDLPGMTYALGFVRSYAQFLKLDINDIVNRFKLEHAVASTQKPEAPIIETSDDDKTPDRGLLYLAAAVFAVVVIWVLWPSSQDAAVEEEAPVVSAIPDAPVLVQKADPTLQANSVVSAPVVAEVPVVAVEQVLMTPVEAVNIPRIIPQRRPQNIPVAAEPVVQESVLAKQLEPSVKPPEVKAPVPTKEDLIVVAPPKGKVVVRATASSWIEILDQDEKTVFKKVMKPGDQYFVPNLPGLTLRTSNAGGLDIFVGGKQAPAIGRKGDIVRGIELSPEQLMRQRIRTRN